MDYLKKKDELSKRKLFVRHHPSYTTNDLFKHFSLFGRVENIDSKTEHFTNKFRNFSYVIFSSEEEAVYAAVHGNVLEKSSYVYCELTIPSHLMTVDNQTSLCGSPLLKAQAKSTKQGTTLSFEKHDVIGHNLGSMAFEEAAKEIKSATIAHKQSSSKNSKIRPKPASSHEAFLSDNRVLSKKKEESPKNVNRGSTSLAREFIQLHYTKPTSKRYQLLHAQRQHSAENLVFRKLTTSWRQIVNRL